MRSSATSSKASISAPPEAKPADKVLVLVVSGHTSVVVDQDVPLILILNYQKENEDPLSSADDSKFSARS
ncbi:uncharacterized protein A4U43_C08F20890 [Asparagus officinalis]|nr:uncharacterized protein A4U43_C08F20890 [Asparagus officinalis]